MSSVTVDSPIAGTTTVSVEWDYSTMATGDGFSIQESSETLTSEATFVITQWDGIPFLGTGSQLFQLAGGVTASDSPTILANTSLINAFLGTTVTSINNLNNWTMTGAIKMNSMFNSANAFDQDISTWDVSNVTDMNNMFRSASLFDKDISSWDVSSVTDMTNMFHTASAFNNGGSALTWTNNGGTANVTSMTGIFNNATGFNQDISSWNVSNVTTMNSMFFNANTFNNFSAALPWNTATANVTNMGNMFRQASAFNQDISGWDVSSVTTMEFMFFQAVAFNFASALPWSAGTGTANVTSMTSMFREASSFNSDISLWNVSSVKDMSSMFKQAIIYNEDLGAWNVSAVTNMDNMFHTASAFNNGGLALTWTNNGGTANVTGMTGIFNNATGFNQDISSWNVSNVTSMDSMFADASVFNNGSAALTWGTGTANVTSMANTFNKASAFNSDISAWSVTAVTTMLGTFSGASAFNRDLSSWDVSAVTSMQNMFKETLVFNNGGAALTWAAGTGTANVTNMATMFNDASAFNQDIRDWVVGSTVPLTSMFNNATAFVTAWYTPDIYIGYNSGTGLGADTPHYSFFNNTQKLIFQTNTTGIKEATSPVENGSSSFTGVTVVEQTNWPLGTNSYAYMWTNTVSTLIGADGFGIYIVAGMGNDTTFKVTHWGGMVFNKGGNQLRTLTGEVTASDSPTILSGTKLDYLLQDSTVVDETSSPNRINNISNWTVSNVTSMAGMFFNATAFNVDIGSWTVSAVNDMFDMFRNASVFNSDISTWDVTAVTNMENMFNGASAFDNAGSPLTWTNGGGTVNVTSMFAMFRNASVFNSDISTWDVSSVTNMSSMFNGASVFNQDISGWTVSAVINMSGMFNNAYSFNNGGAALTWNVSSVINMTSLFSNSSAFNSDISSWNVSSVTSMASMFSNAFSFNNGGAALPWNVSAVTTMSNMFNTATSFNSDISSWNVSSVTSMGSMLLGASAFNYDIRDWVVGSTVTLTSMFNNATAFVTAWYTPDIYIGYNSGTGLGADTPLYYFFNNTQKLIFRTNTTGIKEATSPVQNNGSSFTGVTVLEQTGWPAGTNSYAYMWTNTVTSLSGADGFGIYIVAGMGNDTTFKVTQWGGMVFNKSGSQLRQLTGEVTASDSPTILSGTSLFALLQDSTVVDETSSPNRINNISNWDVSNATSMNTAFRQAPAFNVDISSWVVSNVIDMHSMFTGVTAFNQDIGSWNVSSVTSMASMFDTARAFDKDIGSWDVSSVTSMGSMLLGASAFNNGGAALTWTNGGGPVNVTTMSSMFSSATSFNADINSWNVSNVANFQSMFNTASSFNKPLNSWVISSATTVVEMFRNADAFNQDLSSWVLPSTLTALSGMFQDTDSFNNGEATNTGANPLTWTFPSSITNLANLFLRAKAFNQDISSWNVSAVTRMSITFSGASVFNQDISGWDVSLVTDMNSMFDNAVAFDNGGVALTWAAGTGTAIVNNMANMFKNASAFNSDISGWNVSGVSTMARIFEGAAAFNQDISSWNTSANLNFSQMFAEASLFNYDISGWDYSNGNNFQLMFNNATAYNGKAIYMNLTFGAPIVTNMFLGATQITAAYSGRTGWNGGSPLSTWFANSSPSTENRMRFTSSSTTMTTANLPNVVINTGGSFTNLVLLNRPSVSSRTYDIRFEYASGTTVNSGDGFKLNAVADYYGMTITNWSNGGSSIGMPLANDGSQLKALLGEITATDKPRIDAGTSFAFAFQSASVQTSFNNLENWDIINVTDFSNMFLFSGNFNQDLSGWGNNTVNVVNMLGMFYGATDFNQDISSWNVTNVTSMETMFRDAISYNNGDPANNSAKPLPWTTNGSGTGNVTVMSGMFQSSSSFNQDIGSWDVSNVTDMNSMFFSSKIFNLDISSWVVSSVANMNSMFSGATEFNRDISEWDVSSVTNMNDMFRAASAFNYDIRKWAVDSGCILTNMFNGLATLAFGIAYYNKYPGWAASISADQPTYRFFNETTILKYRSDNAALAPPVVNTDGSFVIGTPNHDTISDSPYTTATAVEYTFTDGGSTLDGFRILNNTDWQNQAIRDIISWGGIPLARNGEQLREYDGVVTSSTVYPTILSSTTFSYFLREATCAQFEGIGSWSVSNVTDMNNAFALATNFNENIGSWQVKNVTDMTSMFASGSFNQSIFAWQLESITVPTNLDTMFNNNSTFDQDIRVWSVPTGTFTNMFFGATAMIATYGPGGANPDPDFATSPTQAFFGQDQLSYMEFTLANTLAVSAPINLPIITADGSFTFLNVIEQSDAGGLKTWRVNFMFMDNGTTNDGFSLNKSTATDFTSMTIISWNDQEPSHPTTQSMPLSRAGSQFKGLTGGITALHPEIPKILNNTSGDSMFENSTVTSMNKLDDWQMNYVTSMNNMFKGATNFNQSIWSWDVGRVTSMTSMFENASAFNYPIANWNTSKVTNVTGMFTGASAYAKTTYVYPAADSSTPYDPATTTRVSIAGLLDTTVYGASTKYVYPLWLIVRSGFSLGDLVNSAIPLSAIKEFMWTNQQPKWPVERNPMGSSWPPAVKFGVDGKYY